MVYYEHLDELMKWETLWNRLWNMPLY